MSKIKPIFRHQIYKSRKHLLNIMQSQGYNVDSYVYFSPNEVDSMYNQNQLDMLLESSVENSSVEKSSVEQSSVENTKRKVYIKYFLDKKINGQIIDSWIEDLIIFSDTITKDDTLFVVTKDDVNDSTKKLLRRIWEKEQVYIVIESIRRLQYNILEHVLVPKHSIMSPRAVEEMCLQYNVQCLSQLPEISRFDPVAKLICIRPNQVCHIQRPSKSAILSDYYRVCV
jgi:DNA-directed RNA polymerase subunit H (RpoH/RPB5)